MPADSHAAQVLMAFWKSSNGRMTLDEATSTTGLSSEDVLAVFRQCDPVSVTSRSAARACTAAC